MCVCVCVLLLYLEDVVGAFAAEVVLARQDDHGLAKDLETDRADELLLEIIHGVWSPRGAVPQRHTHLTRSTRSLANQRIRVAAGDAQVRPTIETNFWKLYIYESAAQTFTNCDGTR